MCDKPEGPAACGLRSSDIFMRPSERFDCSQVGPTIPRIHPTEIAHLLPRGPASRFGEHPRLSPLVASAAVGGTIIDMILEYRTSKSHLCCAGSTAVPTSVVCKSQDPQFCNCRPKGTFPRLTLFSISTTSVFGDFRKSRASFYPLGFRSSKSTKG